MSFEANIPEHIKELQAKAKSIYWQRDKLVHDCDCDYCEYQGDVTDDNQEEWDQLTAQMAECEAGIEKLKSHAKLHGIEVPDAK